MTSIHQGNGGANRKPKSRDDWGDSPTVGLYLRRKSITLGAPCGPGDDAFATYMGTDNDGRYTVGIKDFWTWRVVKVEVFDTLEAMKDVWELD